MERGRGRLILLTGSGGGDAWLRRSFGGVSDLFVFVLSFGLVGSHHE
jgi:hypothetical protein